MPIFRYQAIDHGGQTVTGTMSVHNEQGLEQKLGTAGLWLIAAVQDEAATRASAKNVESRPGVFQRRGPRHRRDLIDFCTLMGFQTKVGVPLVQALDVASLECDHMAFRDVLLGVKRHVEGGLLFWEALQKFPNVFSTEVISVIRAGEQSSKLPETFADLKNYLEWVEQIRGDVRQASLYPLIILVVVSGFVLFLFTAIIPKFMALLTAVNVKLPLITVIVFGLSAFARSTWWIWVLLLVFLTVGLKVGRSASRPFARAVDAALLWVPLFGELNRMLSVSRFAHNLAVLYRAGIPILQALALCRGLVGNLVFEDAVARVEENVKAGDTVSEAIRKETAFPAMLLRMTIMGENTGNLDTALENVSDYYNNLIPRRLKKVFTIMEPAMIVFLVFLVGTVALAIFLPIISLMGTIR